MIHQHIVPAIIPDSLGYLQDRLRAVRGVASRVQIDVMDGTYARTSSWPYAGADREAFEAIRREDDGLPYWQDFEFEIDLLLEKPEDHVDEWVLAGAACLIVHVESTVQLARIAKACRLRRVELALALRPSTDPGLLAPYQDQALFVQCMGSDRIGKHGVALEPAALEQVRTIHARWPELTIGVDIGVNQQTIPELAAAGATRFAAGSAVFGGGDPARSFSDLEVFASSVLNQ